MPSLNYRYICQFAVVTDKNIRKGLRESLGKHKHRNRKYSNHHQTFFLDFCLFFGNDEDLNLKISLIAVGGGIGICHGDKPCFQCRPQIVFTECHARF